MARTIKNDDCIVIKRKYIDSDGVEVVKNLEIGRFYFEASRDLQQCSMQLYFNEPILNNEEKEQVRVIFKEQYELFISDATPFGWDILNIK
ncbi:MAG: hypothetical protein ACRDD7_14725 [Peptostreptococcaceae bacterium]